MGSPARTVFDAFRKSMLEKSEEWKNLISDDVALTGPLAQVKGKQAFIEINQPFFASIRGSELLDIVESGNVVITQITTDVALPDGTEKTLKVCEWYRVEGGNIAALTVYFDPSPLFAAAPAA